MKPDDVWDFSVALARSRAAEAARVILVGVDHGDMHSVASWEWAAMDDVRRAQYVQFDSRDEAVIFAAGIWARGKDGAA